MKTLLIALGALSLLPLSATSQVASTQEPPSTETASTSTSAADVQLFTKLTQEVTAAIENQDMDALSKLMAPEYVHYNPGGGESNKEGELDNIGTWGEVTMKADGSTSVNRYGNTAVTVGKVLHSGKDEKNKPFTNHFQTMAVWVLRDGQWQMAVVQSKGVEE